MRKIVLPFICFFLLSANLYAQQSPLVFKNISRGNGLPVDEITTLAQDSSGFIWIGTPEGLFRYDGFIFKGFSFDILVFLAPRKLYYESDDDGCGRTLE